LQHEHANEDLKKQIMVTESLADAVRTVAGEVKQGFTEVKAEVAKIN